MQPVFPTTMRIALGHLVLAIGLLAGGCATFRQPQEPSRREEVFRSRVEAPQTPEEAACARLYGEVGKTVSVAGVGDGQAAPVEGFPYLRIDRFLAGFAGETLSPPAFEAWVDRMEGLAAAGRAVELSNLPRPARQSLIQSLGRESNGEQSAEDALGRCAGLLRTRDLSDEQGRRALRARAVVSPEYQVWKRVVGIYPLTSLAFAAGIRNWHGEVRETFGLPLAALPRKGRPVRFAPPPTPAPAAPQEVAAILERSARNPLGIPEPSGADAERLFAAFAPVFEIDVATEEDRIGSPAWSDAPLPSVDTKRPAVYRLLSHTRADGKTLLQLNYVIWFPARPKTSAWDILGGPFDGITWRVTLAPDGRPWVYDTMHNCGCYHLFFPTRRAIPKAQPKNLDEKAFSPQPAPDPGPGRGPTLLLAHRTHYIERVLAAPTTGGETVIYRWEDYDALRSLPLPGGGRRSLFRPDGIVPGSERGERFLFWPMGIPHPGAQRQWGHHATAFVGWRHFDDPDLIGRYFGMAE